MLSIFAFSNSFSQAETAEKIYAEINGVVISYTEVNCQTNDAPAQKAYILSVENKNNYRINVSWDLVVWYNNVKQELNTADGENHHSINLEANQKIEGNCEQPFGALYIFKDFITYVSPTKLTKFELLNIKVETN